MSGRSRIPLQGMKGQQAPPPLHEPPLPPPHFGGRGLGPMNHAALFEEMRDGLPFGGLRGGRAPHPAAILEERLAAQLHDIHGLLVDNQGLAATHVALKQELASVQYEIQVMSHSVATAEAEMDLRLREAHEKSMKLEAELRAVDAMRAELMQVHADVQKLNLERQELTGQVQGLNQELSRASADVQQTPAVKAEIETMKQEIQRVRAAIEYEKKGYAENYEQGQLMERNLISVAREVEKLHAEVANAGMRVRAAAASGNQAAGFGGSYVNPDPNYAANPYPAGYGKNPVPGGADTGSQYVSGSAHGSWGAYDMQRAHGRR